jgi:hypothetical protein
MNGRIQAGVGARRETADAAPRVAILLSTCEAYRAFAELTRSWLGRHWPGHPPVFSCGLERPGAPQDLPFAGDPRDWIGIVRQAAEELTARGAEWLYLVLDDHPPVGPCHARYLNEDLPATARRLGAIQVNLMGWDQFQPRDGETLGADALHWQRNAPGFRWKFSLHPGGWHAPTLARMLRQLRERRPDARSARAFEGELDAAVADAEPELRARTYRVRGDGYAAGGRWFERRAPRAAARRAIDVARLAARAGGRGALGRLDGCLMPHLRYLNGPYPMVWSGLVRGGRVNPDALRFLDGIGRGDLAREVRALPPPGGARARDREGAAS